MAKDKEKEITLIDAFKDFKEEKSIDRPVMLGVLKDVFLTQLAKTYGSADNFDVIINVDKGDCEIYQNFEVVEEVENPATEITVEEIAEETGDDDYEIGDTYTRKLSLSSFGRRGILNIRQNLQGRIMDIEKANVFKKYSGKVGEIFTGEVYQTWKNEVLILDEDGNELRMPKSEQIDPGRALQEERHHPRHHQERGDEEQHDAVHRLVPHHRLLPREAVRDGGSGDLRRPDHREEGGPHPGRARQGGRGVL